MTCPPIPSGNYTHVFTHIAVSLLCQTHSLPWEALSLFHYYHSPYCFILSLLLSYCFFLVFFQPPLSPPSCLKHLGQLCLSLPLFSSLSRSAQLSSLHLSFTVSSSSSWSAQREAYYYHTEHNHGKQKMHLQALSVCKHSCLKMQHEKWENVLLMIFYSHIFIKNT